MAHSPPKRNPAASLNSIILASVVVHVEKLFEPLQELEVVLKPADKGEVQTLEMPHHIMKMVLQGHRIVLNDCYNPSHITKYPSSKLSYWWDMCKYLPFTNFLRRYLKILPELKNILHKCHL